jgi:Uma2 family endonuclease
MSAQPKRKYTLEEYLELERRSDERYEYWNGEVFCMSGASDQHTLIETNLITFFNNELRGRGCRVFPANMRLKVPSLPPYRYADLSALCGKPVFEKIGGLDTLTNPSLIIEILSDSTEAYDRGDKFTNYKSIPSFTEYLLIAQHRPHVTQYVKQSDGNWSYSEINDLAGFLHLGSVELELGFGTIYEGLIFPPYVPPPIDRQLPP